MNNLGINSAWSHNFQNIMRGGNKVNEITFCGRLSVLLLTLRIILWKLEVMPTVPVITACFIKVKLKVI